MAAEGWEKSYILDEVPVISEKRLEVSCHDPRCNKKRSMVFGGDVSDKKCRGVMGWHLYQERWHPDEKDGQLVYCLDHHPRKSHLEKHILEPMVPQD